MQQYTPETEAVFRPRPQAEDEKMPRLRGYIVAYTTRKHRIYNIYPIQRDFFGSQNMLKNPDFPFLDLKINLDFSCNLHISPRSGIYATVYPPNRDYVCFSSAIYQWCFGRKIMYWIYPDKWDIYIYIYTHIIVINI